MKKVLIFVMTLMAASSVFAGEGKGASAGEGKEGKRHEMAQLNLTDAQKAQMKTLREKHMAERQAMQAKHRAELQAIMTAEQWTKFQSMRPMRPGMEEGMNREGGKKGDGAMRGHKNMDNVEPEQQ